MRTLLVLIAAAAVGLFAWLALGRPFTHHPVTKAQIEHAVAKRPRGGKVQVVLCNEEFLPAQKPRPNPPHTWTCDTYLGPTPAEANNGPSYEVIVSKGDIKSIRQVPTH